jgi:hypothetical protein
MGFLKMKKWLIILKNIGIVFGALTTAWLLFEAYDQFRDGQKQQLENDKVMMNKIDCVKRTADSTAIKVYENSEAINSLEVAITDLNRRWQFYIDHVDDMTTEQILDAWNLGYDAGKKKELMIP